MYKVTTFHADVSVGLLKNSQKKLRTLMETANLLKNI